MTAPVIIFAYNRVGTLKRTIASLIENELAADTDLYIYSDGARDECDLDLVNEVRSYLKTIVGFNKVYVVNRDKNFGLAKNIVDAVSELLTRFPSVIVLEDDIVTAPYFLKFMNDALDVYSNDNQVCQVSGYSYLESIAKDLDLDLDDIYFIRGADCLAWGTWRRSWLNYSSDSGALANEIRKKKLVRDFNRDNSYNYFKMLRMTAGGRVASWAVNWYAVNFLAGRYILYPLRSLALHIGNDDMATNYQYVGSSDPYHVPLYNLPVTVTKIPVTEKVNTTKVFNAFLVKTRGSFFERLSAWSSAKIKSLLWNFKKVR